MGANMKRLLFSWDVRVLSESFLPLLWRGKEEGLGMCLPGLWEEVRALRSGKPVEKLFAKQCGSTGT